MRIVNRSVFFSVLVTDFQLLLQLQLVLTAITPVYKVPFNIGHVVDDCSSQ